MKLCTVYLTLFVGVSLILSSCGKKNYAFFQNSSSLQYKTAKKTPIAPNPSEMTASISEKPILATTQSKEAIALKRIIKNKPQEVEAPVMAKTDSFKKINKEQKISPKKIRQEIKKDLDTRPERTAFLYIVLVILAVILPPLAVLLVDGLRGPFWLSILLTLLFYVPGLIYALYRIFK